MPGCVKGLSCCEQIEVCKDSTQTAGSSRLQSREEEIPSPESLRVLVRLCGADALPPCLVVQRSRDVGEESRFTGIRDVRTVKDQPPPHPTTSAWSPGLGSGVEQLGA